MLTGATLVVHMGSVVLLISREYILTTFFQSIYPEFDINHVDELFGTTLKRISQRILPCYEEHAEGARWDHEAFGGFAGEGGTCRVAEVSGSHVEATHGAVELSNLSSMGDPDGEIDEEPDEIELEATIASLRNWEPKLPIINWKEIKGVLITGIWNTWYSHYKSWYESLNKREKQEDLEDQEYHDAEPHMT